MDASALDSIDVPAAADVSAAAADSVAAAATSVVNTVTSSFPARFFTTFAFISLFARSAKVREEGEGRS